MSFVLLLIHMQSVLVRHYSMFSPFLDYLCEVRPLFYPVATNIANGLAEPVNILQSIDGIEKIKQIVSVGHVRTTLNPVETVLDQHMFNLVVCTVVWFTIVLFEVGDIHVEAEGIHGL